MPTTAARLPSPPPAAASASTASASSEAHHLVRERHYSSDVSVPVLLESLRASKSTGTLMIDIASGGVSGVRFREQKRIEPT